MIELALPPNAEECVHFDVSPLIEATQSWHVLVDPGHHSLQIPWVRRCRSLPGDLRQRLRDWAWVVRRSVPSLFEAGAHRPARDFDEECAIIAALPTDQIAAGLAEALLTESRFTGEEIVRDGPAFDAAVAGLRARSPEDAERLVAVLADPSGTLATILALLVDYWDLAFADEWTRIEQLIERGVAGSGRQIAEASILAVMADLIPAVRPDRAANTIRFDREHKPHVAITAEGLRLTPSYYVWPHVQVTCDPPAHPRIIFPTESLRRSGPPDENGSLLSSLRALAGETRLELLQLVATEPRSTQELAGLLMLSPAATSRHLHQLLNAGLLRTWREGYYVLYETVPDALMELADLLKSFAGPQPSSGLTL